MRVSRFPTRSLVAALGLGLLAPALAAADTVESPEIAVPADEVIVDQKAACECDESPNQGRLSLGAGLDVPTAYFFRGILQERDGGILQPYAELTIDLWENDAGQSLSLVGGIWNSVHTNKTGATSSPSNWYESDVYAGLSLGLSDFLSSDLTYIAYTSPNGAFSTVQELDLGLSIDDSAWLPEHFSTSPYMTWAFEIDRAAFGASDKEGIYLELGAEPSYEFGSETAYPVTLSVPLALGLSVSNYFDVVDEVTGQKVSSDTFGFFDAGIGLSVPLAFVDPKLGSWSVSAAFHGLSLSGDLADANRGDGFFPWGTLGIAMEY